MHHDVAGLAVFSHHAHRDKIRSAAPRSQRHRVFGAVERGANVVTHSPVDRDIGAHQALIRFYGLYRADLINREGGWPRDCASRFNRNARHVHAQIGALFRHDLGQPGSQLGHGQRVIARNIRDTKSAAQIEFGHRDPPPGQNGGMQVQDPPRGEFEAGQVKDLGSDMRVQPQKLQFRAPNDGLQCRERGARRNREPKFLVLMSGGNELVGRGRDAGRHAHHYGYRDSPLARNRGDAIYLFHRVDDDAARARVNGPLQLGNRLVVAMDSQIFTGNSRAQRDRQLSPGRYVQAQALFGHPAGDRYRQEGLGCVIDIDFGAYLPKLAAKGFPKASCPRPKVRLVHNKSRTPVLRRNIGDAHPVHLQHPTLTAAAKTGGPYLRVRLRFGLAYWVERCRHYILSVPLTPSSCRPLANTVRVASFNHRRVRWISPTGWSAMGETRQETYQRWYWPASASR